MLPVIRMEAAALLTPQMKTEARSLLQSDETWFNPENDKIISLRLLSSPYISRWFFEDVHSKELCEIARLSGMVSHDVAEELDQHEYPMIAAAHRAAEHEKLV